MTTTPTTTPEPVPDDFTFEWPDPADEARTWFRDRMHWPDPVSPLAFSVMEACFPAGFMAAARTLAAPIPDITMRRINTYLYMGMDPPPAASPEAMAAVSARAEARLAAAMAGLRDVWEGEYLPEIHLHLAAWEAFDLPGATNIELLDHLDDTITRFTRLMELHFLAVFPAYLALSELDDCYRELFSGDGAFDAYRLVAGYANKTVEVGHALWRLSRLARERPAVLSALLAFRDGPAETLAALEDVPDGADFAARLRRYLDDYGQRGDKFFDLDRPAWVEDPAPALDRLRHYLAQPDDADPALATERLAADREEARVEVRRRLAGCPDPDRDRFEFLLDVASTGVVISEDHGFWIDFRSSYKVRQVLLEAGRRLVPAAYDSPDDVFLLTLDELGETLREAAGASTVTERRELIAARRDEMACFATVRPPERLGTPLPPPPPGVTPDPFTRSMTKFNGRDFTASEAEAASADPAVIRGIPGSPGRVRGVARVIHSLEEADRLGPGDVLVAETTTPPWTPLFATVAAVVTDTGGVLSHCAVVAREYGMPAVVGTGRGSERIPDGILVEVDGDAGIVRLGG